MPERRDAKLQMIAGPDFLLNGEQMAVIRLRIGQPGFQPALGFVLAEAMRNRDDQRLRHYGFQMVFRSSAGSIWGSYRNAATPWRREFERGPARCRCAVR